MLDLGPAHPRPKSPASRNAPGRIAVPIDFLLEFIATDPRVAHDTCARLTARITAALARDTPA